MHGGVGGGGREANPYPDCPRRPVRPASPRYDASASAGTSDLEGGKALSP